VPRTQDITGQRFGRLVVLERGPDYPNPKKPSVARWVCQCDCGKAKLICGYSLRKGRTKSCGCKVSERFKEGDKRTISWSQIAIDKGFCSPRDMLETLYCTMSIREMVPFIGVSRNIISKKMLSLGLKTRTEIKRPPDKPRKCSKCGATKPEGDFYKLKIGKVIGVCKKCSNEHSRKWSRENKDKTREARRSYKRRNRDKHRLNHAMSERIRAALNGVKNNKNWRDLVDFTPAELRTHLERRFLPGMTWENYGQWHVDHIIPVSVFNFNLASDIDFKRCWCLKNLQPLWGVDNDKKGNRLQKHFQPCLALHLKEEGLANG